MKDPPPSFRSLDITRIHPEFYSVATKMARSALDEDAEGEDAINAILREPLRLRHLDLENFAEKCKSMFGKDYKTIFYFIRNEMESPFQDIRGDYKEFESKLAGHETNVFYMLVNETPETFFEGLVITVTIQKSKVEGGYKAKYIGKRQIDCFIRDENTDRALKPGMIVNAKIIKIEFENLSLKLAIKENPVDEKEALDRVPSTYQPHFRVDVEDDLKFRMCADFKDRFGQNGRYKKYDNIKYPKFKNLTIGQSMEYLSKSLTFNSKVS